MFRHQSIEFVYRGGVNGAASFPRNNLHSQSVAQVVHGFDGLPGTRRLSPMLLKARGFPGTEQIGCLKPAQDCAEIREQLQRLPILDGTRIQEIQRQLIAQEEESILPVRLLLTLRRNLMPPVPQEL